MIITSIKLCALILVSVTLTHCQNYRNEKKSEKLCFPLLNASPLSACSSDVVWTDRFLFFHSEFWTLLPWFLWHFPSGVKWASFKACQTYELIIFIMEQDMGGCHLLLMLQLVFAVTSCCACNIYHVLQAPSPSPVCLSFFDFCCCCLVWFFCFFLGRERDTVCIFQSLLLMSSNCDVSLIN